MHVGKSIVCYPVLPYRHPPAIPLPAAGAADPKGKAAVGSDAASTAPCELAVLTHTKVVTSAYFSPITGESSLGESLSLAAVL